ARAVSVPPIDRMPLAIPAVIDDADSLVPSTLKLSIVPDVAGAAGGLDVEGPVGLELLPPHAIVNPKDQVNHVNTRVLRPAIGIAPFFHARGSVAQMPPPDAESFSQSLIARNARANRHV